MRLLLAVVLLSLVPSVAGAGGAPPDQEKAAYVHAVTRGAGYLPWQERGVSKKEQAFRAEIETRKDALLAHSDTVQHPVLYTNDDLARARDNVKGGDWAGKWAAKHVERADYVLAQPTGWIAHMISEDTPGNTYGFTCPNCVGRLSQEGVGSSLAGWSHEKPDEIRCHACGQTYPDAAFPETATLMLPRSDQQITYFLNDAERAKPDNRSGKLAWHWVGRPIHVSFTGVVRARKAYFMRETAVSLGFAYALTGDSRYAEAARDVLVRFAECYRTWLYHDYWDGFADCDPMYAAWHDRSLPIEWKRHLCEEAFARDTLDKAAMMQTYWGAGRLAPSTDGISGLSMLALAYDLTCGARTNGGEPVWSAEQRRLVERDLLLETIMGAEPYAGGINAANCPNNKAPRIYRAMASVAKCLGIAQMADTALRGYERVRDDSFSFDGFSKESPSYNTMYLSQLLVIPEILHDFEWPSDFEARTGTVDYYAQDPQLRLMYRAALWSLQPSGEYLPLSDTHVHGRPSTHIVHMGLYRYPGLFVGTMPSLRANSMDEYALFHIPEADLAEDTGVALPETCFPAWRTPILRHGTGPDGAVLVMPFNGPGGHRHLDNLALFYESGGRSALGDQGYVGDMPQNRWIRSTKSHNLVVVDDGDQDGRRRNPEFVMMATSPLASVVEATSDAYAQCTEYRRRIVLLKGPDNRSVAIDLFRVAGGGKHAFRIYSEIAASDTKNHGIEFTGIDMPPEPPLPEVGTSLASADIYGLRDVHSVVPDAQWQATWRDADGAYRLWMVSACDEVEASNGPGQRSRAETGRRVRYVDAIRSGEELTSTFVAVHEPMDEDGPSVLGTELIDATGAGARAVAIRVETAWGTYVVLHDFESPTQVADVEFVGDFAVLCFVDGALDRYMTVGASTLRCGKKGFADAVARVSGEVAESNDEGFTVSDTSAQDWPVLDAGAQAHVRVRTGEGWLGYPVAKLTDNSVLVKDYPLPEVTAFELPSVRYHARR
ncbi:MAG: hypothetical protein GY851_07430 [bacterium]|nr:hypothetical protein [bacterium]